VRWDRVNRYACGGCVPACTRPDEGVAELSRQEGVDR